MNAMPCHERLAPVVSWAGRQPRACVASWRSCPHGRAAYVLMVSGSPPNTAHLA